jgi:hypothetical protein
VAPGLTEMMGGKDACGRNTQLGYQSGKPFDSNIYRRIGEAGSRIDPDTGRTTHYGNRLRLAIYLANAQLSRIAGEARKSMSRLTVHLGCHEGCRG